MEIKIEKKLLTDEGYMKHFAYSIFKNDMKVGGGVLVEVYGDYHEVEDWKEEEEEEEEFEITSTYVENIDVLPEYQNKGIGTAALKMLAEEYDILYLAPTDEKNQRLNARLGEECSEEPYVDPYVDQGFGLYRIH